MMYTITAIARDGRLLEKVMSWRLDHALREQTGLALEHPGAVIQLRRIDPPKEPKRYPASKQHGEAAQ